LQVVVEVRAVGVNPVETYIRSGNYGRVPPLPYTPGADGAGIVHAVGDGVTRFHKGDRVYVAGTKTGSYAQYTLAAESQVYPLPERVSFSGGASINIPYGTAYKALVQKCRPKAGQTVLVHGATGGVGIAAVQIGLALGLKVIGTAGSDEGRQMLLSEGVHHVFSHKEEGYMQKINELTQGGADIVLEMLANINLQKDLEWGVRQNGIIVVIGNRGEIQINPRAIMSKECVVTGVALATSTPDETKEQHSFIGAGLANGTLRPVVGMELPLVQAPEAHHHVIHSPSHGKIILLPFAGTEAAVSSSS